MKTRPMSIHRSGLLSDASLFSRLLRADVAEGGGRRFLPPAHAERAVFRRQNRRVAACERAVQKAGRERVLHFAADEPPQGTRAVGNIVAPLGEGDRAVLVRLKRDAERRSAGNGLRKQPPRDLGAVLAR